MWSLDVLPKLSMCTAQLAMGSWAQVLSSCRYIHGGMGHHTAVATSSLQSLQTMALTATRRTASNWASLLLVSCADTANLKRLMISDSAVTHIGDSSGIMCVCKSWHWTCTGPSRPASGGRRYGPPNRRKVVHCQGCPTASQNCKPQCEHPHNSSQTTIKMPLLQ